MTQITDKQAIKKFITAGKAEFTLESNTTGTHFTFKVSEYKDKPGAFFVKFLNGPDSYGYAGMLFQNGQLRFVRTAASPKTESPVVRAINWFINQLDDRGTKIDQVEFHHIGKCGRCGRKLTTPESILTGLGPICANK